MLNIQDLDLKSLRIFVAVVECQGYAGAQVVLRVGQSTISECMTGLETRLGMTLCIRGRAGFRITEKGHAAYAAAKRALAAIDDLALELGELRDGLYGKLNIGVIDNTITDEESPIRPALRNFYQRDGQVELHLMVASPIQLEQYVAENWLHAAIGTFPTKSPNLTYTSLYEEKEFLYCHESHPLFESGDIGSLPPKDIKIATRGYNANMLEDKMKNFGQFAIADSIEAQALLIFTGACIGFLPEHYARKWEESGDFTKLSPDTFKYTSKIEVVRRESGYIPRILDVFLGDLMAFAET